MSEHTTGMPAALRRRREYAGPILFSYGFRPFFLGGALWAAFGMMLWLPQYFGELTLPTVFSPLDWHIHETLYGYVAAIATGFLLTAIPNWTGRLPVNGYPLSGLNLQVGGTSSGGRLCDLGRRTRRSDRHCLPCYAGSGCFARDRRRQKLAQSTRSRRARHADRRQH
jgi:hypothetical protein